MTYRSLSTVPGSSMDIPLGAIWSFAGAAHRRRLGCEDIVLARGCDSRGKLRSGRLQRRRRALVEIPWQSNVDTRVPARCRAGITARLASERGQDAGAYSTG